MNIKKFLLTWYVLTQVYFVVNVISWCDEGHEAIGMVAMSSISSKTASQIKRLLGGKDIVDISSWGHKMLESNPSLFQLHLLLQPSETCDAFVISNTSCPQNKCLVRAIQYVYSRLMGKQDLISLESLSHLSLTDSDCLKYLVTLLGDLHQPLRLGLQKDQGGESIVLVRRNTASSLKNTTIFRFWESELVQSIAESNPSYWYGGWTHANSLGSALTKLREEWINATLEKKRFLFETWGEESYKRACNFIYKDLKTNKIISNEYQVDSDYDYSCFEIIRTQLLTAGVRIALVLDTVFKHRDITQLRQGSAFDSVFESKEPNTVVLKRQRYLRNFCINICIILATLVILVYVLRFYSPNAQSVAVTEMGTKPKRVLPEATDKFS